METEAREIFVFEFDKRFEIFRDRFVFYDFNNPLSFSKDLREKWEAKFDYVCVDPPFLSEECWEKTAKTVEFILKPGGKLLVCTGLVMSDFITKTLKCHQTVYEPKHANGLANDFRCFVNYKSRAFIENLENEE